MLYQTIRHHAERIFRPVIGTVEGAEHIPETGPFLLAANHIDYLDGFFITFALISRNKRMVKFLTETNNYWWTGGAAIPVNPNNKVRALEQAEQALGSGSIICIFPEGARNSSNALLPGKTGIARLALWNNVPVIPLGLIGGSGRSPADSLRTYVLRGNAVRVRIGKPIAFPRAERQAINKPLLEQTTDTIMEHIAILCNKTYHHANTVE